MGILTESTFSDFRSKDGINDPVALSIKNVSAYYGKFRAISNISLEILKNKVTSIIGPSGCGKSTFIRCINRIHEEFGSITGSIELDGQEILKQDPVLVRQKIGMVFQKPQPFPSKSIFENVAIGLRLNGIKDEEYINRIVEESFKSVSLWDEVKDKLKMSGMNLSGGQQQRLCMARALAIQPKTLLLDEPCSALDPISTSKIEELILKLKENYTIVIVTHNMQQAARISDFTAFLLLGKLIEFCETKHIFTNPSKKETEDYITGRFG